MSLTIQLSQFTGPFDLLLALVQDEKMNISEIAISKVTEQFMQYLDTLEERHTEELADFLVVAARLLLLKSSHLLPQFALEEDEGPSLSDQLKMFEMFAAASKQVNGLWQNGRESVFRIEPPRKSTEFSPPDNFTIDLLRERMLQLIVRLTPPKPLPETHIDKAVSMKQKIDDIRRLLGHGGKVNFHELLHEAKNRTEVIVSFLALLELVKLKFLVLKQDEGFGDILVERV